MKKLLLALGLMIAPALAASLVASPAFADDAAITVHLRGHKFYPATITVKANQPSMIILYNDDATADEFDSSSLKIEKVVPGHAKGNIRVRPLAPGKYPFMGEYNAATAQGVVVSK